MRQQKDYDIREEYPKVVYMITHNVTNRKYIGRTNNLFSRYMTHLCLLRNGKHHCKDLQDDFDKYGGDLSIRIVDKINNSRERRKEIEAMDFYNTCDRRFGYNYKDPHVNNKNRTLKKEANE